MVYQLPVLEEAPRMIRGMITSGMKKGMPESERATFVPVMHNETELKKLVAYNELDDAYLIVSCSTALARSRSRRMVAPMLLDTPTCVQSYKAC